MKSGTCPYCDGTGMKNRSERCPQCGGSGNERNGYYCPYCNANLSIDEPHARSCPKGQSHPLNNLDVKLE